MKPVLYFFGYFYKAVEKTTDSREDPHPTFRRLFAVDAFNGPAPKSTDARLFGKMSPSLLRLQKQSRADLRQKARASYWTQKQQAQQQTQQQANDQSASDNP